ncbi:hypothetical protein HBO32_07650 [Pseudomonas nitroreducens]|uniref:hypothetical protein n=1 Tax=Pseudomonas TaxID=286 RepID=UPI0007EE5353|nr:MULTISPECIES: hypothetical protein [Pseudomonas]NMZ72969.1 hypothetical protein [Pseudomonas nitroreducens]OBY59457.1 hypothetical protein A9513_029080 [Pseudomonas sp. AU12215]
MSKNVPVRFLKGWRTYFTNDVAGFDKERAEELVEGGVAEYASEAASAAPTVRKNNRKHQVPAPAPTPPATSPESSPPVGEAGEGSDSDDEEKP